MFYNTNSYENLKDQLQERLDEHARIRKSDIVAQGNSRTHLIAATRLGRMLIQIGTRLEQFGQPARQFGG
jgi:hypothetical protein